MRRSGKTPNHSHLLVYNIRHQSTPYFTTTMYRVLSFLMCSNNSRMDAGDLRALRKWPRRTPYFFLTPIWSKRRKKDRDGSEIFSFPAHQRKPSLFLFYDGRGSRSYGCGTGCAKTRPCAAHQQARRYCSAREYWADLGPYRYAFLIADNLTAVLMLMLVV